MEVAVRKSVDMILLNTAGMSHLKGLDTNVINSCSFEILPRG